MAKLYIGNTDHKWFDFLSVRQPLEEVNFWQPSTKRFRAIEEGELFLFHLKSPRSMIGGYGTLSSSVNATIEFVWDSLGSRNGMNSIEDMIKAIGKYRKNSQTDRYSEIGCRIIVNPVFFKPKDWFEAPSDWSKFTVSGKSYDLLGSEAQNMIALLQERTPTMALEPLASQGKNNAEDNSHNVQFGTTLSKTRLGQDAFRVKVAKANDFCCSFSGTTIISIIDAAHIIPVKRGGQHKIENALFLRKDLHWLFDLGLITVSEKYQIEISPKIAECYKDFTTYQPLQGKEIKLPKSPFASPSQGALAWHRENVFIK